LLATLDEKSRRRLAGLLALLGGRGGVSRLADITGMSRTTIGRGRAELGRPEPQVIHERVRHPGGGRKAVEKSTLNF
jgi:DNA-binding phage protein